jgi:uncharacterized protein YndB with AHSA1/START domain
MSENLELQRDFDAPPAELWRAWTDPKVLASWFGPDGWSVPEESVRVDPRRGGEWHLEMVSDEDPSQGAPITAELVEFVENELLVGRTPATEESGGNVMELRVALAERSGGGTRMTLTQGPYDAALLEMAAGGWTSSFGKLDRHLSAL